VYSGLGCSLRECLVEPESEEEQATTVGAVGQGEMLGATVAGTGMVVVMGRLVVVAIRVLPGLGVGISLSLIVVGHSDRWWWIA